ncbi:MAG: esterase-like activity of phytase family protein [Pseudomonadota bacterium]
MSGLLIDGDELRAVGDRGVWLTARLERNAAGAVTAFRDAEIGPLRDRRDAALFGRRIDAESLARDGASGVWIGFEQRHRITARDALGAPARETATQLPTARLGRNSGIEGLARGPDGALWAIAETLIGGAPAGWRLDRGVARPFRFERIGRHKPTGADFGPDGALYVLERDYGFFRGVRMRIRRFADPVAAAEAGDLGRGEILVDLDQRARIDNMEALSAEAAPDGSVILTVLSDDNFNAVQQTILLQFQISAAE